MTLDEAIWRETALAESFRKRIKSMETTDTKPLERLEQEHRQMSEWLRELKVVKENSKDLSQMMFEIYLEGVNMAGEYHGCWVRYKDIERIIKKYATKAEVNADEDSD